MTGDFQAFDIAAGGNGVTLEQSPLGGPVLRLTNDQGTALVALQGAQLIGWAPAGHDPVIWLSPVERLANPPENPKPVRGGTPICWPWFATHPTDPSKPPHGFVRTRQWAIDRAERSATAIRVTFSIATTDADKALWLGEASLQFTVTLDDELTLALTTRNTGSNAFSLTQALHTYFAVSDISNVSVEGLDGQTYMDKLDANARKQQAGPITFAAEVDRVYDAHEGAASITDRGLKRRIEITKSGSRSSVVWNPWIDKCNRLGDMGQDGYRGMVCVETCNAGADIVHISPKAAHTISASYKVVRL
jgi:glucose-6-phosphate 1-epimerase